ncbi:MAG: DUF2634 domain-containing protein [Bacillota bacterium]|nr:DUF2634 domain-containing protein [Bacillota bacterium]
MSIFPFFKDSPAEKEQLEIFKEYAYDFETNAFLKRNGREYLVHGDEALKIWIRKALLTERYKFKAYDDSFGSELNSLVGMTVDIDIVRVEIKRMITEALLVNPYILEVDDFRIFEDSKKREVSFSVKTIYSDFKFELENAYGL